LLATAMKQVSAFLKLPEYRAWASELLTTAADGISHQNQTSL